MRHAPSRQDPHTVAATGGEVVMGEVVMGEVVMTIYKDRDRKHFI